MPLLIINADDFGYSAGINHGILDAFTEGILTSATLMANMPGFDMAADMARANPDLGIGVHLVLTCGSPLLADVPTITAEDGSFRNLSWYESDFEVDSAEVYREWRAQIERVRGCGIVPDHLDSHHHVNIIPQLSGIFERLAREYGLPVRNNYDVPSDVSSTRRFEDLLDRLGSMRPLWRPMAIRNFIGDVKAAGTSEAICHPGYIDAELQQRSSFTTGRIFTAAELKRSCYRELLKREGIELGTFSDLNVAGTEHGEAAR